jgi:hypothetical protein
LCDVSPDVPDQLVGDPGRLFQIFANLIGERSPRGMWVLARVERGYEKGSGLPRFDGSPKLEIGNYAVRAVAVHGF